MSPARATEGILSKPVKRAGGEGPDHWLRLLAPYSDRMKKLMEDPDKYYTPKVRPSGHVIGKGFAKDKGGAIPPNLL